MTSFFSYSALDRLNKDNVLVKLNKLFRLKKTLPISKVTIEVANFDIQKIINPDVQGKEYQQGSLYGYQNMKSYLMTRERGMPTLRQRL